MIEPLISRLGYSALQSSPDVKTREGLESGGFLLVSQDGKIQLRVWAVDFDIDLDAPSKRGRAYRYSHTRIAQRVLLASGERLGLITNGVELRLLIGDPARPDSQIVIKIDPLWKRSREVPDSYILLLALASPAGIQSIPKLVEQARLQQTRVTKELRVQARQAVEKFVQEVLDHPRNREYLSQCADREKLAKDLWREGLITVYRLLFVLKLESTDDPARALSFASSGLWRNSYSPSMALTRVVRDILDRGAETGEFLEQGLRSIFRMFESGLECAELNIKPLGGALFGKAAAPILSRWHWGERGAALLLDRLLWTTPRKRGASSRERVHYGPLDVEDLGRVYEALLELEPGIATELMCRLRRSKLEVVVPAAQGEKYKPLQPIEEPADETNEDELEEPEEEEETSGRGKKTKVEWMEEIPPGRFYLRVGLGRKATGSYYTPHSFVRFLTQETLGPILAERCPKDNPQPGEILKIKVLDPAMGSGHFLVEACRYLGEALYEACRLCDELALKAESRAERAKTEEERKAALEEARQLRQRIVDLPDPNDEMLQYLPSRAPEREESGVSQRKAEALCRRLAAVHCLYGVDKNPLAVELAKLSLWIEAHGEGLPLTFLDHRLIVGDSLTGPFWTDLLRRPGSQKGIENLWEQMIQTDLSDALHDAIRYVSRLEAEVGVTLAQMEDKTRLKREMDRKLAPFRALAAAWTGGVMLGPERCDDGAYEALVSSIAQTRDLPETLPDNKALRNMLARGLGVAPEIVPLGRDELYALMRNGTCIPAIPYDLTFPEAFYPTGVPHGRRGFDVVLGNPPWDAIRPKAKEFFAAYDFEILSAPTKRERTQIEKRYNVPQNLDRGLRWKIGLPRVGKEVFRNEENPKEIRRSF
ncbi:MAG: hypothetical protein AB1656_16990 [Candidatus Omnitrophota bacterium]